MTHAEFRAIYTNMGLTQEGIAKLLDIHPATIRSWPTRKRGVPVMAALAIRQVEWDLTRKQYDDEDGCD